MPGCWITKACITILNNDEQGAGMHIPLPVCAGKCRNVITGEEMDVNGGRLEVFIDGNSGIVLRLE